MLRRVSESMEYRAVLQVTLVVAVARNGVIGLSGDMPWRMPSSLRRFRRLTLGRPMIMGRKTYDAIGRPLDGRDSIVVTRRQDFSVPGVHRAAGLGDALRLAEELALGRGVDEIVIAGGGEIYRECLPFATRVEIDLIDAAPAGDTTFPDLDPAEWREVQREPIVPVAGDEHPAVAVTFQRIGAARPVSEA
jgi:dihydrofolate reductase